MNLLSHTDPVFFLNADKDSPLWGSAQDVLDWLENGTRPAVLPMPIRPNGMRLRKAWKKKNTSMALKRDYYLRRKARRFREILDK